MIGLCSVTILVCVGKYSPTVTIQHSHNASQPTIPGATPSTCLVLTVNILIESSPPARDNFIYKLMKDLTEGRLMRPDRTWRGQDFKEEERELGQG